MAIKSKGKKPKVSMETISKKKCPENMAFSFEYLTNNKHYNFGKLDKSNFLEWNTELLVKIVELTHNSWQHWFSLSKKNGAETIPFKQVQFTPNGYDISDDEKVIVFRFKSGNGRILGIKDGNCPIYYVIGMDVDYSAYNHGS